MGRSGFPDGDISDLIGIWKFGRGMGGFFEYSPAVRIDKITALAWALLRDALKWNEMT